MKSIFLALFLSLISTQAQEVSIREIRKVESKVVSIVLDIKGLPPGRYFIHTLTSPDFRRWTETSVMTIEGGGNFVAGIGERTSEKHLFYKFKVVKY